MNWIESPKIGIKLFLNTSQKITSFLKGLTSKFIISFKESRWKSGDYNVMEVFCIHNYDAICISLINVLPVLKGVTNRYDRPHLVACQKIYHAVTRWSSACPLTGTPYADLQSCAVCSPWDKDNPSRSRWSRPQKVR